MKNKYYIWLTLCLTSIICFSCYEEPMDHGQGNSNSDLEAFFTATEAREFFENKMEKSATKSSGTVASKTNNGLTSGEFTPQWNKAKISQNDIIGSVGVPIISEFRYMAIRSEFVKGKAKAYSVMLSQQLLVVKGKQNNQIAQYVLTLIPDRAYYSKNKGDISDKFLHAGDKGGFSGIAIYSRIENSSPIKINRYRDGKMVNGVHFTKNDSEFNAKKVLAQRFIGSISIKRGRIIETRSSGGECEYELEDCVGDVCGNGNSGCDIFCGDHCACNTQCATCQEYECDGSDCTAEKIICQYCSRDLEENEECGCNTETCIECESEFEFGSECSQCCSECHKSPCECTYSCPDCVDSDCICCSYDDCQCEYYCVCQTCPYDCYSQGCKGECTTCHLDCGTQGCDGACQTCPFGCYTPNCNGECEDEPCNDPKCSVCGGCTFTGRARFSNIVHEACVCCKRCGKMSTIPASAGGCDCIRPLDAYEEMVLSDVINTLENYDPAYKNMLDRLAAAGITLKFQINRSIGIANYSHGTISFKSSDDINFGNLSEEVIHASQHFIYGTLPMNNAYVNIEFEAKVVRDILCLKAGDACPSFGLMGLPDELYDEYNEWIRNCAEGIETVDEQRFHHFCDDYTGYTGARNDDFIPQILNEF